MAGSTPHPTLIAGKDAKRAFARPGPWRQCGHRVRPASHFRRNRRAMDGRVHRCLRPMRPFCLLALAALLLSAWCAEAALAQSVGGLRIEWEVKSRFRLFRNEADFQRHVAAYRNDGILAAEGRLARESDGRGWARDIVARLCV